MSQAILELRNLSKTFRSHWTFRPIEAVREISLTVEHGEAFGFLGHNGAGKTTTMKMIVGLLQITKGSIWLDGAELLQPSQHRTIGYLPELPYFYDHLTVEETLDFFARLHEIKQPERSRRVTEVLEQVKLIDRRGLAVRTLSKGLQQRLGLAQAIINRPKLLLLDEPFSGLDPMGRVDVRELITQLKREGTTIFLSSHVLSDVEDICDRVSIMSRGVLAKVFRLEEIPQLFGQSFELTFRDPNSRELLLQSFATYEEAIAATQQVVREGKLIEQFRRCAPKLEEIFMSITRGAKPPA